MDIGKVTGVARKLLKLKYTGAVIVAAGNASRMQGIDKVMAPIAGEPMILRTVRQFQNCDAIKEIVVVTREDLLTKVMGLCRDFDKVKAVVVGGKDRQESVERGMNTLSEKVKLVAIHDGARPFVSQELIERCIQRASIQYAAVPVIKSVDTLREVDENGTLTGILDREHVVRIQTPQIFLTDLIKGALTDAVQKEQSFTDDAAAMERMGTPIQSVEGDADNIKLTTPQDLVVAEAILKRRREAAV